jgi:hypothetical protein
VDLTQAYGRHGRRPCNRGRGHHGVGLRFSHHP